MTLWLPLCWLVSSRLSHAWTFRTRSKSAIIWRCAGTQVCIWSARAFMKTRKAFLKWLIASRSFRTRAPNSWLTFWMGFKVWMLSYRIRSGSNSLVFCRSSVVDFRKPTTKMRPLWYSSPCNGSTRLVTSIPFWTSLMCSHFWALKMLRTLRLS